MIKFQNKKGCIFVSDAALSNITGAAATSCFGVKGMAGRSKDGGPLQLLRRESMSKGVRVTFHEDDTITGEAHAPKYRPLKVRGTILSKSTIK